MVEHVDADDLAGAARLVAAIPMSKDNVFFGVPAYDADGYRSPVRFMDVAKE